MVCHSSVEDKETTVSYFPFGMKSGIPFIFVSVVVN